jgi:hypothetical protein
MLNILLNHSPAFVIAEIILAVSLAMFAVALVGAVREKYAIRVPAESRKRQSTR